MRRTSAIAAVLPLLLGGCDYLGIESAVAVAERKQAEAQAIGAGCRHAARSVEECYANNRRADKAAIFAGWKDMNDYMRENNIEAVPPRPETALAAAPGAPDGEGDEATVEQAERQGGKNAR